MDKVNIIIFDEEEITKTLVESYLKELTFSYDIKKYNEFDESVFEGNDDYNLIIVNVSRNNLQVLDSNNSIFFDLLIIYLRAQNILDLLFVPLLLWRMEQKLTQNL